MSKITNEPNPEIIEGIGRKQAKYIENTADELAAVITQRRLLETEEAELKERLKSALKPAYFKLNEDATDTDNVNHTYDLEQLQVNFVNKYHLRDQTHVQELAKLLGSAHPLLKHLYTSAKITIDVTELDPQIANELAAELTKVAVNYNIRPQVVRSQEIGEGFHSERHVVLTAQDNLILDEVLPLQVQINTID